MKHIGKIQVKPTRKLDNLSFGELGMLLFFSLNENTEVIFSETLILTFKVFKRNFLENKLKVIQSHCFKVSFLLLNPFHATCLFLFPLNASENQRFSDNFRGYRKRPAA